MACSIDGYVAQHDSDTSWMNTTEHYTNGVNLTTDMIQDYLAQISCYVMGSYTYELALKLGWPYGDKPVYVLSSRRLIKKNDNVQVINDSLEHFLKQLKLIHQNIWIVGGPKTINEALHVNLVDELIISHLPVLLGHGIPFFITNPHLRTLHLLDSKAYTNGIVESHYQIIANE